MSSYTVSFDKLPGKRFNAPHDDLLYLSTIPLKESINCRFLYTKFQAKYV